MKNFKVIIALIALAYGATAFGYTCLVPNKKSMTPPTSTKRTFSKDALTKYGSLINVPSKGGKSAAVKECKKHGGTHLYTLSPTAGTYSFSASVK